MKYKLTLLGFSLLLLALVVVAYHQFHRKPSVKALSVFKDENVYVDGITQGEKFELIEGSEVESPTPNFVFCTLGIRKATGKVYMMCLDKEQRCIYYSQMGDKNAPMGKVCKTNTHSI